MKKILNYLNLSWKFLSEIYKKKYAIYELAKRDFEIQYKGSYLGLFWTYIQPFLFIMLIWSVLTFGFKLQSIEKTSHTIWLITGMIPWLFFSEVFISTSSVVQQYSFLIKKVDFSLGILPLVKILSSLITHFVFLIIACVIGMFYGNIPSLLSLQIFYYIFSMCILLVGLGWLTSSTSLFVKDINNIVALLVQFGFWLTPIFWSVEMIPPQYKWIVEINPVYYIVSGYRDALIYNIPFWQKSHEFFYFWIIVLLVLITGAIVFRRLRPHFAEVV